MPSEPSMDHLGDHHHDSLDHAPKMECSMLDEERPVRALRMLDVSQVNLVTAPKPEPNPPPDHPSDRQATLDLPETDLETPSPVAKDHGNGDAVNEVEDEGEDEEDEEEEDDMDFSSNGSMVDESENGSILESPLKSKSGAGSKGSSATGNMRTRRNRRQGSFSIFRRLVDERVRHKRQTLQDMARPLKQWLYQHRDNPYPTKSEKVNLAQGSQMTLTQVSNWFANARRRLKNTVKDPNLSWGRRIKLYNSCVVGNAELLSISSDDSMWDSDDDRDQGSAQKEGDAMNPTLRAVSSLRHGEHDYNQPVHRLHPHPHPHPHPQRVPGDLSHTLTVDPHCDYDAGAEGMADDPNGAHPKYKHSILQRYLNDAYEHSFSVQGEGEQRRRNPSGSLSSHDYEEMSTSSRSSPLHEHSFFEDNTDNLEQIAKQWGYAHRPEDEMYWKEISAALALTTLARSRSAPTQ